ICGTTGKTEACHNRIGFFGKGIKPNDSTCTPMCWFHHQEQHAMSEALFWKTYGKDPVKIAAKYYEEYGGTGGKPRARKTIKPRIPKHQRSKIPSRKSPWPSRKFPR